jgi:hypothetical protein
LTLVHFEPRQRSISALVLTSPTAKQLIAVAQDTLCSPESAPDGRDAVCVSDHFSHSSARPDWVAPQVWSIGGRPRGDSIVSSSASSVGFV